MDARKAVIGPLAGFRRGRCPIASRKMEAGLPVKVRLVRKSWCRSVPGELAARVKDTRQRARCRATSQNAFGEKDLAMELQRQFATIVTPSAKSEEPPFPCKGVIGEIKMVIISRTTPCSNIPIHGLRVACPGV